jgi:hypothetical protein
LFWSSGSRVFLGFLVLCNGFPEHVG